MWISPAYAQGAGGGGGDMLTAFLPLVLIFVVFYFLLIRPQQKKAKDHREMLGRVRRGDRVVTNGGIIGTVSKVNNETELTVEIAEGVKVLVARGMIAEVLTKNQPAGGVTTVAGGSDGAAQKPAGLLGSLFGRK